MYVNICIYISNSWRRAEEERRGKESTGESERVLCTQTRIGDAQHSHTERDHRMILVAQQYSSCTR